MDQHVADVRLLGEVHDKIFAKSKWDLKNYFKIKKSERWFTKEEPDADYSTLRTDMSIISSSSYIHDHLILIFKYLVDYQNSRGQPTDAYNNYVNRRYHLKDARNVFCERVKRGLELISTEVDNEIIFKELSMLYDFIEKVKNMGLFMPGSTSSLHMEQTLPRILDSLRAAKRRIQDKAQINPFPELVKNLRIYTTRMIQEMMDVLVYVFRDDDNISNTISHINELRNPLPGNQAIRNTDSGLLLTEIAFSEPMLVLHPLEGESDVLGVELNPQIETLKSRAIVSENVVLKIDSQRELANDPVAQNDEHSVKEKFNPDCIIVSRETSKRPLDLRSTTSGTEPYFRQPSQEQALRTFIRNHGWLYELLRLRIYIDACELLTPHVAEATFRAKLQPEAYTMSKCFENLFSKIVEDITKLRDIVDKVYTAGTNKIALATDRDGKKVKISDEWKANYRKASENIKILLASLHESTPIAQKIMAIAKEGMSVEYQQKLDRNLTFFISTSAYIRQKFNVQTPEEIARQVDSTIEPRQPDADEEDALQKIADRAANSIFIEALSPTLQDLLCKSLGIKSDSRTRIPELSQAIFDDQRMSVASRDKAIIKYLDEKLGPNKVTQANCNEWLTALHFNISLYNKNQINRAKLDNFRLSFVAKLDDEIIANLNCFEAFIVGFALNKCGAIGADKLKVIYKRLDRLIKDEELKRRATRQELLYQVDERITLMNLLICLLDLTQDEFPGFSDIYVAKVNINLFSTLQRYLTKIQPSTAEEDTKIFKRIIDSVFGTAKSGAIVNSITQGGPGVGIPSSAPSKPSAKPAAVGSGISRSGSTTPPSAVQAPSQGRAPETRTPPSGAQVSAITPTLNELARLATLQPTGCFEQTDAECVQSKLALQNEIPIAVDYRYGKARNTGDCFYDSVAQFLNGLGLDQNFTPKSVRKICQDYVMWLDQQFGRTDRNWIFKSLGQHYDGYLKNVRYTAEEILIGDGASIIYGVGNIDGRILCEYFKEKNLKIHIVEIRDPTVQSNGRPMVTHHLINLHGERNLNSSSDVDYGDSTICHLITYRNHTAPIRITNLRPAQAPQSQDVQLDAPMATIISTDSTGHESVVTPAVSLTAPQRNPNTPPAGVDAFQKSKSAADLLAALKPPAQVPTAPAPAARKGSPPDAVQPASQNKPAAPTAQTTATPPPKPIPSYKKVAASLAESPAAAVASSSSSNIAASGSQEEQVASSQPSETNTVDYMQRPNGGVTATFNPRSGTATPRSGFFLAAYSAYAAAGSNDLKKAAAQSGGPRPK